MAQHRPLPRRRDRFDRQRADRRRTAVTQKGANTTRSLHLGILGGYPIDFLRIARPPAGVRLTYLERDCAKLRLPATLDAVLVVSRFVSHRHWKQLRSSGLRIITVQGGWTSVDRAIKLLSNQQGKVDSNE